MKRMVALLLSIVLLLSMGMIAFAAPEIPGRTVPDDSAMNLEEARAKGIPYDKPLHEKTREELIREGYRFYGGTVPFSLFERSPQATTTGVLGYITAPGNTTVYSGQGTGTNLGYVSFREIVYVSSFSGSGLHAYVQFKNASGVLTYGYIPNSAVYTPAYGWSAPVTSGKIMQYYGDTDTDPKGHTGVDVGGFGTSNPAVRATYEGTASFRETTKQLPNGSKIFADYGKHIRLVSGNYDVNYAHLSSFEGVASNNYASEGFPVPQEYTGLSRSTVVLSTKTVTKNAVLGYVGSTGKSSGKHLHFEVRNNGTLKDPFTYIVFPNVSWAK